MMHALDDAVHDHTGKAEEGMILPKDQIEDRTAALLEAHHKIVIEFNGDYKLLQDILKKQQKVNPPAEVCIVSDDVDEVQKQNPGYEVVRAGDIPAEMQNAGETLRLTMCEHVSKVEDTGLQKVYIDPYSNLLENERDLQHFAGYQYNRDLFLSMWKVLL